MINVQVNANSIKPSDFGTKFGRAEALGYKAVGYMQCSSGLQPC